MQHILQVVCRDTVLVGHALNFDLAALRLRHENVVDTSFLYRVDAMNGRVFALRDVVAEVFGQDCQPVGQAHGALGGRRRKGGAEVLVMPCTSHTSARTHARTNARTNE